MKYILADVSRKTISYFQGAFSSIVTVPPLLPTHGSEVEPRSGIILGCHRELPHEQDAVPVFYRWFVALDPVEPRVGNRGAALGDQLVLDHLQSIILHLDLFNHHY